MVTVGRGALCLLAAAVLVTLLPEQTIARPRTYVTHDCQSVKARPKAILFACADGGYYVKRLRWRS